jgi:signal transduction histidine kinase
LDRMRQLMLQLREGAAPAGAPVGVDLSRIARTLEESVRRRGRVLDVDVPQPVATRGHDERMERVIGHLINNALDATAVGQRVWLRIDRHGSHARVEVGDNGQGMSETFIRDRLFKPFQTTKNTGMGIGAYESFQYVQELGGKIDVRSREGEGTVVTLLLPLIESFSRSDLQTLEEA